VLLAVGVVSLGFAGAARAGDEPKGTNVAKGTDAVKTAAGVLPGAVAATLDPQVVEGIIKATPTEVWNVFATAEGFKKLGVAQCEMDFRVGGLIRSHYNPKGVIGDEGTIQNRIISFEPGHMVSFRIDQPPKGFPFSEATWKNTWSVATFTDLGDGTTHLRLAGIGYPDTEEGRKMREFFERGNGWVVQHLQQQFDSAAPVRSGAAHAEDPLAPIELETVVERSRAEVWRLLSTNEGWKQFLGTESAIELTPGGKFEVYFSSDAPAGSRGSEGCTVLSYIPNEMLSYSWNAPPKFAHARARHTWVVIRLEDLTPTRTREPEIGIMVCPNNGDTS
jgi:uncharacterized protein YndB with AHSA1/START domain